jgi:hypothetical protein
MTPEYLRFINATYQADDYVVRMFLFALLAIVAYPALAWLPAWMRRPAQLIYLALMLVVFVATVYLSSTVT